MKGIYKFNLIVDFDHLKTLLLNTNNYYLDICGDAKVLTILPNFDLNNINEKIIINTSKIITTYKNINCDKLRLYNSTVKISDILINKVNKLDIINVNKRKPFFIQLKDYNVTHLSGIKLNKLDDIIYFDELEYLSFRNTSIDPTKLMLNIFTNCIKLRKINMYYECHNIDRSYDISINHRYFVFLKILKIL